MQWRKTLKHFQKISINCKYSVKLANHFEYF